MLPRVFSRFSLQIACLLLNVDVSKRLLFRAAKQSAHSFVTTAYQFTMHALLALGLLAIVAAKPMLETKNGDVVIT
jgi:hypothetical protein